MEIDADIQSNIRCSSGNPAGEKKKNVGVRRVEDTMRKFTQSTNLVSQELTEIELTEREPVWDSTRQSMCYSYIS